MSHAHHLPPGTPLTDEAGSTFAVVVQRGWDTDKINAAANTVDGLTPEKRGPFELAIWRSCTKAWREANNITEFDEYWAPDGDGRRTIDVAVWS